MTAISVTAAQVAEVDPIKAGIHNYITGVALTKGQAVYVVAATGKLALADANGTGTKQFRGIALDAGGVDAGVRVLESGDVYGFDLSGLNYDAPVYLSATAGSLDTAADIVTVYCGRVGALTDSPTLTKVLRVAVRLDGADWA